VISCCLRLGGCSAEGREGKKGKNDALEVPAVFLVNEDQVEVVSRREFLVDIAEGGSKLESAEEESNRDCFACSTRKKGTKVSSWVERRKWESQLASHRRAVHNLELGNRLALVVLIRH
jgi:hypothetical protein